MLTLILVLLILAWFLGYVSIPGIPIPPIVLFNINGHDITVWNLLVFLLILWAINLLPSPLREIAAVILILWILSTLGIIAIAGLASILVIAVIVGLILAVLGII